MDMQGNELDELFRSSLDGLEIEPSPQVWADITKQIDADKRKRSLIPFLSIAAGIILMLVIGVLLIPKQVKVNNDQHPLVKRVVKGTSPMMVKVNSAVLKVYQKKKKTKMIVIASVNHLAASNISKAGIGRARKLIVQKEEMKKNNGSQPGLATRGDDLASAVMPDNSGD